MVTIMVNELNPSELVALYREERPKYKKVTRKIKSLLEELLKGADIKATVECRTKKEESFSKKITREDKRYKSLEEITDLSGVRVILHSLKDVEKTVDLINKEFIIDNSRSINKLNFLDADRFGYLSQHFVVKVNETRKKLPEWTDVSELWTEIQVRTALQHAWAVISHSLNYKTKLDIPKVLQRRLYRLSALFELADEELDSLINEIGEISDQYRHRLDSKEPNIELNADSLTVYLETSEVVEKWSNFTKSLDIKIAPIAAISRDVEMAKMAGIKSINELDKLLLDSMDWGEDYLRLFYHNTFDRTIRGRCYSHLNGIVTLFLIGNYPDIFTNEVLEKELEFRDPWRATDPAKMFNPKYAKNGG